MRTFTGRTCVVTGAGSGIGRALATELAARGARVAISDVDEVGLEVTRAACAAAGAQVLATRLDVTDLAAWRAHAAEVVARFGAVHLLVNNAGVALVADALEQTIEDVAWVMDVDFNGVLYGTQVFLPHLVASGDGALVNVSSLFGIIGVPSQSAYNAAKFAVRGYTEAIAQEMDLAGHPVSVHTVHPGGIRTDVARNARTVGAVGDAAATFDRIARTSPEACAQVVLRGVLRGRRRILVGADAWALHLSQQLLGVRYQALVRRGMGAALRRMRAAAATAGLAEPSPEEPTARVG